LFLKYRIIITSSKSEGSIYDRILYICLVASDIVVCRGFKCCGNVIHVFKQHLTFTISQHVLYKCCKLKMLNLVKNNISYNNFKTRSCQTPTHAPALTAGFPPNKKVSNCFNTYQFYLCESRQRCDCSAWNRILVRLFLTVCD
jgi:hypothetical protein